MKFTASRDGKPRATVSVRFRIDRWKLETAAALAVYNDVCGLVDADADAGARIVACAAALTRSRVNDALRDTLYGRGLDGLDWPPEDAVFEECAKLAPAVIDRLWPELREALPV